MVSEALLPVFVNADVWLQLEVAHPLAVLLAVTLSAVTAIVLVRSVRRVGRGPLLALPHRPTPTARRVVVRAARPRAAVLLTSGHGARAPGATERRRSRS